MATHGWKLAKLAKNNFKWLRVCEKVERLKTNKFSFKILNV